MSKGQVVGVRLLQGAAGPVWAGRAGDVVWLEVGEARGLVEGGFGELVDGVDGVEEATAPVEGAERAVGVRERSAVVKRPTAPGKAA